MSCINAINTVPDYMRIEIEGKSIGQACFLKLFQKTFDTLDHGVLSKEVENYGFRGP